TAASRIRSTSTTPRVALAARAPNARSTRPPRPSGMKSVQLSMSMRRTIDARIVAASTIHGAALTPASPTTLPTKDAANPSSGSASAAARDAEVNESSAPLVKTIGIGRRGGTLAAYVVKASFRYVPPESRQSERRVSEIRPNRAWFGSCRAQSHGDLFLDRPIWSYICCLDVRLF